MGDPYWRQDYLPHICYKEGEAFKHILENPDFFLKPEASLSNPRASDWHQIIKTWDDWRLTLRAARRAYDGHCKVDTCDIKSTGPPHQRIQGCGYWQWSHGYKEWLKMRMAIKDLPGAIESLPGAIEDENGKFHSPEHSDADWVPAVRAPDLSDQRRLMTSIPPIEPLDGQNVALTVSALAGMVISVLLGKTILKRCLRKPNRPDEGTTHNDYEYLERMV